MVDKLDDIKRLSPRERLEKLRDLQKKNKKEIEQAQELMKESEREIEIEEELKDIPIPQVKAVDVQQLFTPEEKEVFRMKRFVHETPQLEDEQTVLEEKSLEETIAEEAEQRDLQAPPQYGAALDEAKQLMDTLTNAYGTIKDLSGQFQQGTLSQEDTTRLEAYAEAAHKLYESGFKPEQDMQAVINEADRLLYATIKQSKGESGLREDYIL